LTLLLITTIMELNLLDAYDLANEGKSHHPTSFVYLDAYLVLDIEPETVYIWFQKDTKLEKEFNTEDYDKITEFTDDVDEWVSNHR